MSLCFDTYISISGNIWSVHLSNYIFLSRLFGSLIVRCEKFNHKYKQRQIMAMAMKSCDITKATGRCNGTIIAPTVLKIR